MKVNHLGMAIEQGECRPPVAVAGLTDRTGIDQVSRGRLELQGNRFGLSYRAIFGTKAVRAVAIGKEPTLQMSMAKKSERGRLGEQGDQCVSQRNYVEIFVCGRTMHKLRLGKSFECERPLGQRLQPLVVLGSQLIARPDGRGRGQRIKVTELDQAGRRFVMIAADKHFSQPASALDNFVWRGAVADNVAKIRHEVILGCRSQTGFERFEVGVDVAEQQ